MKLYTQHLSMQVTPPSDAAPVAKINAMALLGVLLALAVMLVITIPAPLHTIRLGVPLHQARAATGEVVVVQVDANGLVQWNGDTLNTMAELNARIALAAAQKVQVEISLQPAPDAPFALVAAVMVMARQAGLQKVGIGR